MLVWTQEAEGVIVSPMTMDLINDLLSFDHETGMFFWRVDVKKSRGARKGVRAGAIRSDGYVTIKIRRKGYYAHRLSWFLHHGEWPKSALDHINGNPSDNRICNLREATWTQNACNRPMQSNNKAGLKGVGKIGKRFRSRIRIHGKEIHLGSFPTAELAHESYLKAAKELHGEFSISNRPSHS